MIKAPFIIALYLLLSKAAIFGEVKLSVSLDDTVQYEDTPLSATLTVEHDNHEEIDIKSATADGKSLELEFVKEVRFSPSDPTTLTIYHVTLPGQSKGLHSLPEITLKVGGKPYHTYGLAYEVKSLPQNDTTVLAPTGKSILLLEAFVDPVHALYPGERARVGYRYYFNADFKAVKEEIPLLDAEGFKKIGGKQDRTVNNGNLALLEVSQLVEADQPGTYTYGPSVYEAYPVQPNPAGKKVSAGLSISATAPKVTIVVNPFPEEGRPISFKGAVGEYTIKSELVSGSRVKVGEKVTLSLMVEGKGALNTVKVPDICCQPNISGFFKLDELPPPSSVSENSVSWQIDLRPLTASVKEIPSFIFSFFNSDSKKYETVKSAPIAISVEPLEEKQEVRPIEKIEPVVIKTAPEPLEIAENVPLSNRDILENPFLTWWSILLLPLVIATLIYQLRIKDYLDSVPKVEKVETSTSLYEKAMKYPQTSDERVSALKKCLYKFLEENGVQENEIDLSIAEGQIEPVKKAISLISSLDQLRYSSADVSGSDEEIANEIKTLITHNRAEAK